MRPLLALAGLIVALAAVVPAQEPARPPAAPPPAPPSNQEQPIFRTGINFVRVDVIVTDRQGNPVSDLKQTDFEVFEDNKPQTVETFRLVKIDMAATPTYTERGIRTRADEETAAADDNARIFVFFLDEYQVRREGSMAARKPLVDFVQTQVSPGDLLAVMYPLTPLDAVVLTRAHDGVARTLQQFEGRKYDYEPRNASEERYAYYPTETVERIRRQVSLSALKGLAVKLGALREGRKAIILVSEGYSGYVPPQKRDAIASMPGSGNPAAGSPMAGLGSIAEDRARMMGDFDVLSELQSVFDAANRTNTAIYAVDPRGLAVGEYDIRDNINFATSSTQLRATQDTLRVLADNTDGRAIVNRNDLAKGMQQIVRDSSAYYLLGYNSTQAPQDGKFHPIRVRVKRPGVDVRARKGFWALTAEETTRAAAAPKAGPPPAVTRALATIAPMPGRRLVRTWIGHGQGQDGKTRVTFLWEPVPAPPGVRRDEPRHVSLVATTASGGVLFRARVPDGDAVPGKGGSVSFEVDPGKVELRMSVEGDAAAALDVEDRDIVVPDLTAPEVRIGTPRVLVARNGREYQLMAADAAATPVALREFRRTDRLLVRFEAFGPGAAPIAATARLLNRQGTRMSDLPVAAPSAAGQPYVVDLPLASLAAGEYLLEIAATAEGQEPATELVAFRLTS